MGVKHAIKALNQFEAEKTKFDLFGTTAKIIVVNPRDTVKCKLETSRNITTFIFKKTKLETWKSIDNKTKGMKQLQRKSGDSFR